MYQSTVFLTIILFTVANLLTSYLYLYPIVHGCAFPSPPAPPQTSNTPPQPILPPQPAPFRLLLLGDPQLEGSTSLLPSTYSYFPSLRTLPRDTLAAPSLQEKLHVAQTHLHSLYAADIPIALASWRKQLDLLGNDFYLAHIYRTLSWFTHPSHTAVLGDLLGSQWIDDEEFESRGRRYWERVFSGGKMVGKEITLGGVVTRLGVQETDEQWKQRVINVAGNHDVGYAGDMTFARVQRFERVFGKVNWETRFTLPVQGPEWMGRPPPELRLVVLNSLNIDSPAGDLGMQTQTYKFMGDVEEASGAKDDGTSATILLTHLPLHKEEGVCVDGPMIRYAEEHEGGGIREQNHLSSDASAGLLNTFFGMSTESDGPAGGKGSSGIIFTGHDHEGCDVYHHLAGGGELADQRWAAERWNVSSATKHASRQGIREVTVRSMMGEFGGNAGLLSAWFNAEKEKWEFEYVSCALGKQHLWWAVHVLDIVALVMCLYIGVKLITEAARGGEVTVEKKTQ